MEFLKSGLLRKLGHAPPNANSKAQPDTTPNGDSESIPNTTPNDISKFIPKSASSATKKKASKREALLDEKRILYQKKHLAVKTIAKTLAQIEESRSFLPCINMLEDVQSLSSTWSSSELLEFEIGSAFAHLILPEHDVIAVTTNHLSAYQDSKGVATRLGILACTSGRSLPKSSKSSDAVEEKCQSPIGSSSKLEPTCHYFVHAEAPRGESAAKRTDVSEYLPHIIRQWQVPELKVHLWVLGQLLTTIHMRSRRLFLPKETYPTSRGLLYVYVLCCTRKKIGSRLQAEKSLRLLESLRKIQHFSFSISRPTPSSNLSSTLSNTASHHSQYSDSEIDNDHHFLQHVKRFKSKLTPLEIPEIMKIANGTPSTTRDFEFYSERTCHEFHRLLVNLLDRFSDVVATVTKSPNLEGLPPDESAAVGKSFGLDVKRAHILAYALTKLARSRAFRMHMQNIELLLDDAFKPATPRTSSSRSLYGNPELSVDTALDEIFDDRGPNESKNPNLILSQVYVKWLRLLVSPFAACDFLVHYVTWEHFKFTGISIKLLVVPQPSQKTLSWPELFADTRLFPSESPTEDISDSVTNEDINVFFKERFEKAKSNQLLCDTSCNALKLWNRDRTKTAGLQETLTTLVANVETLEDDDRLKGDVRSVQLLLLENDSTTEAPNAEVCQELDSLLTTIASRCRDRLPPKHLFYLEFGKQDDFSWTLHPEVYLASVLETFTQHRTNMDVLEPDVDLKQLKGYGRVIGTARSCCPICHRYLNSIAEHSTISDKDKAGFFIRPVFIASCFPGRIPDKVLDDVISTCGGEVRLFLVSLMPKEKPQVLFKPTSSWLRLFKRD